MGTNERMARGAAVTGLVALMAVGCGGGAVHKGDVSPESVEKKAHTMAQRTADAIRPAAGPAAPTVDRAEWQQCTTETPGVHRFEYTYVLKVDVPQERSKAVLEAARAHFTKEGYDLDVPDPKTPRVSAREAHSSWWVGVGESTGAASMFISVDSDCVFTSHDPKKHS